ncbi:hypothetical protein ARMGADRAFT_944551, partial [Armillaria gallica]
QHNTHILSLLKGQVTIPCVFAYGQLKNFQYMAMKILGLGIAEQWKKNRPGTGVMLTTLAGLEHIHLLWIVHCDTKPEKLLSALDDLTINIIDFDISKSFIYGFFKQVSIHKGMGQFTLTPLVVPSFYSYGVDLAPCNDLKSLAYIALFLLGGILPWTPHPHEESQLHSQDVIMKSSSSGKDLSLGFPVKFSDLLDYSCSLHFLSLEH